MSLGVENAAPDDFCWRPKAISYGRLSFISARQESVELETSRQLTGFRKYVQHDTTPRSLLSHRPTEGLNVETAPLYISISIA